MSPRLVWVLGQCLWLATFLVVSLIIYGILNFFPNILSDLTYLQVCMGHFLWRILKSDLPVDTIPAIFQKQKMNDVTKQLEILDEELKKLKL
tara:strand:+ start:295 stop:570 length:276 start_codon:yes stop_codon:yes gene_type:complete